MGKRKTPQQKKAESYKYDRRNAYGESDKGSRKAIPRNKAITRRIERRTAKQQIVLNDGDIDIVPKLGKRPFEKYPDMPLEEFLDHQQEKRQKLVGRKKRARKEFEERQQEEAARLQEEERQRKEEERIRAKELKKQRWLKAQKKQIREEKS